MAGFKDFEPYFYISYRVKEKEPDYTIPALNTKALKLKLTFKTWNREVFKETKERKEEA